MWKRFILLNTLLTEDGVLFVHLDDSELAYCKVILDELFGRSNYLNTITMTTNEPSGFKATGATIFSTANYVLCYAKNKTKCFLKKIYIEKGYDKAYSKVILNPNDNYSDWRFSTIVEQIAIDNGYSNPGELRKNFSSERIDDLIAKYALENASKVFRTAAIGGGAKLKRQQTINKSIKRVSESRIYASE